LGLVGKGVTFDTGGLSIKKATNMHYMKSDMGGAAAVLGAMELVARLKLRMNIDAVIPVAENSVDAKSIRPGDVIGSYAGKSIEVIDTDAEGRLILADGLSYIQQQSDPEMLVDLATLTGSCVATLGYHAAGLFSNNDPLADQLTIAGELSGARVWRLPIWESYADELQSDVADIKNLSGQPVAGAITAAKFLEAFVREKQQWAHLDIAGVAFGSTDHAKMKSATGYGVRLLLEFIKSLILTKSR
jgi:leucyl aminopeptidase